jgi:hypothetical protein
MEKPVFCRGTHLLAQASLRSYILSKHDCLTFSLVTDGTSTSYASSMSPAIFLYIPGARRPMRLNLVGKKLIADQST